MGRGGERENGGGGGGHSKEIRRLSEQCVGKFWSGEREKKTRELGVVVRIGMGEGEG